MKSHILVLFFIPAFIANAQENPVKIAAEVLISGNRTSSFSSGVESCNGFGTGIHLLFMEDRPVNLILGLEFNRSGSMQKEILISNYIWNENVVHKTNCISFPIGIRYNLGTKTKIFAEAGIYSNLMLWTKETGITHQTAPTNNKTYEFEDWHYMGGSFGVCISTGIRIPVSNHEFIIKPDYRLTLIPLQINGVNIYDSFLRLNIGLRF